jgi:hypothetical protein
MSEATDVIHPATLYAMDTTDPEALTVRAASVPSPEGDALVVFRSRADAEAYRADTGNHPASEGWRILDLDRDLIARLLEVHGLGAVVMPEEWTGTGGTDLFTAAGFLELLDTAERVA